MKNILFPTDFSDAASNAFIYALQMADKLGASITTLHAYQRPNLGKANIPHTLTQVYESIQIEEFEDYKDSIPLLRNIAAEYNLDQVPLQHVMKEGETIPTVLRFAKENNIELIVMGTEGASGFVEIFKGSVAGEILEKANCPVLVVPEDAKFDGSIDRIAFTTEFSDEEKKALPVIQSLAQAFDAKVFCVNADIGHTEPYAHRMEKLQEEISGIYTNMEFTVIDAMDIESAISQFVENHQIDILAMLTHKRSFLQELFNYSMTKKMAYHLDTPVLAIQAHNL